MRKAILLLVLILVSVYTLIAQNKNTKTINNKKGTKAIKTVKKYPFKKCPVYLGRSNWLSGNIDKYTFDSLIAQGLFATDSAGINGVVTEFRMYYKERNVYEDTIGNFYVDYEMLTDLSKSNKLNTYAVIDQRTKPGDTVIFDDILVKLPDSVIVQGVGMKFAIVK